MIKKKNFSVPCVSLNFTLGVKNKNLLEIRAIKLVSKAIYTTIFKMTLNKEAQWDRFFCIWFF